MADRRATCAGELKWIAEGGSQAGVGAPSVAPRKSRERLLAAAVAGMAIVIALTGWGAFAYFRPEPQQTEAIRFFVSPPETWSVAATPLAVSPDGRRMAFVATGADGKIQTWIRSLDSLIAQAVPGTDGVLNSNPFWSPDSRFLAFFAGGKLMKIDISGGTPIKLCDVATVANRGGAWSRSGTIVFGTAPVLQKVPAAGGTPSTATTLGEGETDHRRPSFLPDGRHFLYRAYAGAVEGPIYLASLDSAERTLLLNSDAQNAFYSEGHLLFLRETTLMAQPFDAQRLELTGEAFPIAEQIRVNTATPPTGIFSASESGVLAYQTGVGVTSSQLTWLDRSGKQMGVLGDRALQVDLRLSPTASGLPRSFPIRRGGQTSGFTTWRAGSGRGSRSTRQTTMWRFGRPTAAASLFDQIAKGTTTSTKKLPAGRARRNCCWRTISKSYP